MNYSCQFIVRRGLFQGHESIRLKKVEGSLGMERGREGVLHVLRVLLSFHKISLF